MQFVTITFKLPAHLPVYNYLILVASLLDSLYLPYFSCQPIRSFISNCLLGWLLKYGRYKLSNGLATKMRVLNCLMGWQLKCDSYKLFYGLATKM
jgi:hypothetical protein